MKVCGFDLFGALSKNTGQTTADKMNKSGAEEREKDIGRRKEAGESVISTEYLSVSGALREQSAEIQNRSSLSHQWRIHRPE